MNKHDQRASLLNQMRAFAEAHPQMNDEQLNDYKALEDRYDALDAEIKREERLQARLDEAKKPTTTPMTASAASINSDEYKASFDMFLKGANPADYRAAMTIGTDSDGGYLVPEVYQAAIIARLNTIGVTRSISTVISTASTTNIPVEGEAPTFTWIDEAGAYGTTNPTLAGAQLNAWKLGGIIKVSEELLQDANLGFDGYMAGQIAVGIDKAERAAFATGDGTKKPTGYAYSATVGASSTTASATAVTADEIIDIFYDLKAEYRASATWRMTDKTEKAVRKLKNTDGDYIFAAALEAGSRNTLLGRPIVIDNSMDEIGAGKKFIVIGDFANYQIADRGDIVVQRLNERYAEEGMVGFKVSKRVDAKITLAEAFNAGKNAAA